MNVKGATPQANGISDLLSALRRLPNPMSSYYWSQAMNPTIRLGTLRVNLEAGAYATSCRWWCHLFASHRRESCIRLWRG